MNCTFVGIARSTYLGVRMQGLSAADGYEASSEIVVEPMAKLAKTVLRQFPTCINSFVTASSFRPGQRT